MTRIRVTPEGLIRAAQQMADIGARISQAASELNKALGEVNPRAYQGQLYPKVAQRTWAALAAANSTVTNLQKRVADLFDRAKAFIAADLAAIAGVENLGPQIPYPPSKPTKKPQPMPPPPIPLNPEADPKNYSPTDGCVRYAQDRRPDLGKSPGDGGADNYLDKFSSTKFQITEDDTDLTTKIAVGYAIVWPRGHPDLGKSAGSKYGHIAIVEEVGPDYVIISQAGWGTDTRIKITREQLRSLFIIP